MKDVRHIAVQKFVDGHASLHEEAVAVETLIHLRYNGTTLVSLLGSPEHADELGVGHLLTEYNVPRAAISDVSFTDIEGAVFVEVTGEDIELRSPRTDIVTISCGACDQDDLHELTQRLSSVSPPEHLLAIEDITGALKRLREHQQGFQATGGMHAAALLNLTENEYIVREDIGRHNAVDKVYGAWCSSRNHRPVALLLSGRCGWDIVAKAASMNTPVVASFGAASSLAIDTARASGITLVSFVKDDKAIVIGPVEGRFHRKH